MAAVSGRVLTAQRTVDAIRCLLRLEKCFSLDTWFVLVDRSQ